MRPDYLTERQYEVLLDVLSRFGDRVERVDVYGSRARRDHQAGSDIDLIVAGDVGLEDVLRMAVALDESSLSIFADIQRYTKAHSPKFTAELARDARVLFTKQQLLDHSARRDRDQAA